MCDKCNTSLKIRFMPYLLKLLKLWLATLQTGVAVAILSFIKLWNVLQKLLQRKPISHVTLWHRSSWLQYNLNQVSPCTLFYLPCFSNFLKTCHIKTKSVEEQKEAEGMDTKCFVSLSYQETCLKGCLLLSQSRYSLPFLYGLLQIWHTKQVIQN